MNDADGQVALVLALTGALVINWTNELAMTVVLITNDAIGIMAFML